MLDGAGVSLYSVLLTYRIKLLLPSSMSLIVPEDRVS